MNKWIFFSLILLFAACDSTKKTTNTSAAETNKCKIPGVIKDYTGLDGCQFLIELENGEKWMPVKVNDESFVMADGVAILFAYKEVKDAVSTCMTGSKMIEITCIKKSDSKPNVPECKDISDPLTVKWMKDLMDQKQVTKVMKYNFRDGWAYMLFSPKNRYLYDCQGTNLCPPEKEIRDCFNRYLPLLSDSREIYNEGPDE